MPVDVLIALATAALAAVAVAAAVVAVRAERRLRRYDVPLPARVDEPQIPGVVPATIEVVASGEPQPAVRVTDGAVVVQLTAEQVLAAVLARPGARVSAVGSGLRYAFRPESRDRIRAAMRRDFHSRRKARLAAGRRATRMAPMGSPR